MRMCASRAISRPASTSAKNCSSSPAGRLRSSYTIPARPSQNRNQRATRKPSRAISSKSCATAPRRVETPAHVLEAAQHALGDGGTDERFAGRDGSNRIRQLLERDVLQQVAARARLHAFEQRLVIVECRQQDCRRQLARLAKLAQQV